MDGAEATIWAVVIAGLLNILVTAASAFGNHRSGQALAAASRRESWRTDLIALFTELDRDLKRWIVNMGNLAQAFEQGHAAVDTYLDSGAENLPGRTRVALVSSVTRLRLSVSDEDIKAAATALLEALDSDEVANPLGEAVLALRQGATPPEGIRARTSKSAAQVARQGNALIEMGESALGRSMPRV